MLTRSNLAQHTTLPQLPPFSLDTSDPGVQIVSLETFWKKLSTSQSGYIGNSISGTVQLLVHQKN